MVPVPRGHRSPGFPAPTTPGFTGLRASPPPGALNRGQNRGFGVARSTLSLVRSGDRRVRPAASPLDLPVRVGGPTPGKPAGAAEDDLRERQTRGLATPGGVSDPDTLRLALASSARPHGRVGVAAPLAPSDFRRHVPVVCPAVPEG